MTADPFYKRSVREINDIEQPAKEYATSRGWFECKFTSPGTNAMPDRFFARRDKGVVLCEFKKPGEEPNAQQAKRHQELRDHGVTVVWFDNLQDAKTYFR